MERTKKKKKQKQTKDELTWERLVKTPSGRQVKIQYYVTLELLQEMKEIAPILHDMERNTKGRGIKKETPGMVSEYCAKTMVAVIKRTKAKMDEANKGEPQDAVASDSHIDG